MLIKAFALMAMFAAPAMAQQNRALVIPDGDAVAVPARGALPTVPLMAPRSGRPRMASDAMPMEDDTLDWRRLKRLWPLVPLGIAAAVVAGTLPGGGGGGSAGAPAATR